MELFVTGVSLNEFHASAFGGNFCTYMYVDLSSIPRVY